MRPNQHWPGSRRQGALCLGLLVMAATLSAQGVAIDGVLSSKMDLYKTSLTNAAPQPATHLQFELGTSYEDDNFGLQGRFYWIGQASVADPGTSIPLPFLGQMWGYLKLFDDQLRINAGKIANGRAVVGSGVQARAYLAKLLAAAGYPTNDPVDPYQAAILAGPLLMGKFTGDNPWSLSGLQVEWMPAPALYFSYYVPTKLLWDRTGFGYGSPPREMGQPTLWSSRSAASYEAVEALLNSQLLAKVAWEDESALYVTAGASTVYRMPDPSLGQNRPGLLFTVRQGSVAAETAAVGTDPSGTTFVPLVTVDLGLGLDFRSLLPGGVVQVGYQLSGLGANIPDWFRLGDATVVSGASYQLRPAQHRLGLILWLPVLPLELREELVFDVAFRPQVLPDRWGLTFLPELNAASKSTLDWHFADNLRGDLAITVSSLQIEDRTKPMVSGNWQRTTTWEFRVSPAVGLLLGNSQLKLGVEVALSTLQKMSPGGFPVPAGSPEVSVPLSYRVVY